MWGSVCTINGWSTSVLHTWRSFVQLLPAWLPVAWSTSIRPSYGLTGHSQLCSLIASVPVSDPRCSGRGWAWHWQAVHSECEICELDITVYIFGETFFVSFVSEWISQKYGQKLISNQAADARLFREWNVRGSANISKHLFNPLCVTLCVCVKCDPVCVWSVTLCVCTDGLVCQYRRDGYWYTSSHSTNRRGSDSRIRWVVACYCYHSNWPHPPTGERSVFSFKDNGILQFMKKLDFNPTCFYCYSSEPPTEGVLYSKCVFI